MFHEILKFNNNFAKLQAQLIVTKDVNSELSKQVVTWNVSAESISGTQKNDDHKVVGIPQQVAGKNLKTKMLPIFQRVGFTIETDFSDNCHCPGHVEKNVSKSLKSIKT